MEHQADDPLKRLLRDADAAAGPPPQPPADLPARLLYLHGRRRHIRMALGAGAVAAMLTAAVGLSFVLSSGPDRTGAPRDPLRTAERTAAQQSEEIASLRERMERLEAEIESRIAVVKYMQELEAVYRRRDELRRELVQLDAPERMAREIDEAAFLIIYDADRKRRSEGGGESVLAAYRHVIRLFPQTRWAKVARKRLEEIEKL